MEANDSSDFTDENNNQTSIKAIDIQKKRTLLSKNSIGNKHLFNQQLPKKKSKSALHQFSSEITAREHFKDMTIVNQIEDLSYCCPVGGEHGCCLKHFVDDNGIINYENAVQYIKNCRVVSKEGSSSEIRDPIIINLFKSCIQDDTVRGEERIFVMDYLIPSPRNLLGRDNVVKCCRKAIFAVYGISEYEWKLTSSLLKKTENGNLQTLHHKPYSDATLHEYTHAEVAKVFKDNLNTEFPGDNY